MPTVLMRLDGSPRATTILRAGQVVVRLEEGEDEVRLANACACPAYLSYSDGKEVTLSLTLSPRAHTPVVPGTRVRFWPCGNGGGGGDLGGNGGIGGDNGDSSSGAGAPAPYCCHLTVHPDCGELRCRIDNGGLADRLPPSNTSGPRPSPIPSELLLRYALSDYGRPLPLHFEARLGSEVHRGRGKAQPPGRRVRAIAEAPPPRYHVGTRVLLVRPEGALVDAVVASDGHPPEVPTCYAVRLTAGESEDEEKKAPVEAMVLNTFNHCIQGFPSAKAYRVATMEYCEYLARQTATVEDAITGVAMPSASQIVKLKLRHADGASPAAVAPHGGSPAIARATLAYNYDGVRTIKVRAYR